MTSHPRLPCPAAPSLAARCRRRGFSLIELMVVLVILGILAGVVGFNVIGAVDETRVRATKQHMQACNGGLEVYRAAHAMLPDEGEAGLKALVAENLVDPGTILDAWKEPMYFTAMSETAKWEIWSNGPDRQPGTEDDIVHAHGALE